MKCICICVNENHPPFSVYLQKFRSPVTNSTKVKKKKAASVIFCHLALTRCDIGIQFSVCSSGCMSIHNLG